MPKINKKNIISRLVEKPKNNIRLFYAREMKLLNELCSRYSLEFMDIVDFGRKLDSLTYLTSPKLKETLDKKFRAFNFSVDVSRYPSYDLSEKYGDDLEIIRKPKTVKDFLNAKKEN